MRGGAVAAALAAALAGCGALPASPLSAPRTLPALDGLPALVAAPVWTAPVASANGLSVAGDASVVAGLASGPSGLATPWAFAASGALVPLGGASGSAVFALPGGLVVLGPGVADPAGTVTVFRATGARLWSGPAVGPITAVSDSSGSRLAILDSGSGSAVELASEPQGALQALTVPGWQDLGPSATIDFDDAGEALLVDAQQAALYDPQGQPEWDVPLGPSVLPRALVLDRDGAGVTVSTTSGQSTLYQFVVSAAGRPSVAWSETLAAGGSDTLVAGPDGRVAVVGVGGPSTVAVYRETDGGLIWQDTLPSAGSETPTVTGLAFAAGGGVALAATGCDAAGDACVLLLSPSGEPLGRLEVPGASSVTLAADAEAAVATLPPARPGGPATVAWYDLQGLWPAPPAAGSSAS